MSESAIPQRVPHARALFFRRLRVAAAICGFLCAALWKPAGAADPAVSCEVAKNRNSAVFASCLHKSHGRFAKTRSAARLSDDLQRCEEKLSNSWRRAESKAAGACPTIGDEARLLSGIRANADCVASALATGDASCLRGAATSSAEEALNRFISAFMGSAEFIKSHPFYDSPQDRAEGIRRLLRTTAHAIQDGFDDKDFPVFSRRPDHLIRGALDNPDNTYYQARIHDDRDYRITGTRGTTASLVFQSLKGYPGVGTSGPSDGIDILDQADMIIEPDGTFEIIVSRDPQPGNWLRIEEGAETIIVRYSHSDWDTEEAGTVHITQLGYEGSSTPEFDESRMAEVLDRASLVLTDTIEFWPGLVEAAFTIFPPHYPLGPLLTRNGLDTQYYVASNYELADDEALIITAHPSAAEYQGIQLGEYWFESFEYAHRQTSLTTAQADLGSDGVYRFVVTKNDPGVANWLDTEGHPKGLIFMRWQGLEPVPEAVTMHVVPFSEIQAQYPPDVPILTPEERRQAIAARQAHIQRRYDQ